MINHFNNQLISVVNHHFGTFSYVLHRLDSIKKKTSCLLSSVDMPWKFLGISGAKLHMQKCQVLFDSSSYWHHEFQRISIRVFSRGNLVLVVVSVRSGMSGVVLNRGQNTIGHGLISS